MAAGAHTPQKIPCPPDHNHFESRETRPLRPRLRRGRTSEPPAHLSLLHLLLPTESYREPFPNPLRWIACRGRRARAAAGWGTRRGGASTRVRRARPPAAARRRRPAGPRRTRPRSTATRGPGRSAASGPRPPPDDARGSAPAPARKTAPRAPPRSASRGSWAAARAVTEAAAATTTTTTSSPGHPSSSPPPRAAPPPDPLRPR